MKTNSIARTFALGLLSASAVLLIVTFLIVIVSNSASSLGLLWWLAIILLFCASTVATFALHSWWKELQQERRRESRQSMDDNPERGQDKDTEFVKIAGFTYHISDDVHSGDFSAFIDEPVPEEAPTNGSSSAPASQFTVIETIHHEILSAAEKYYLSKYGESVRVVPQITRHSLEVAVTVFFGTMAVLAQYHDLVESATLFNNHMQRVFGRLSQGYRQRTGNAAMVRTDMVMVDPARLTATVSGTHSGVQPNGAASTPAHMPISPTPTTNTIDIDIDTSPPILGVFGCIISGLALIAVTASIIVLTSLAYCILFNGSTICGNMLTLFGQ
jgi:hypothetical protein